MASTNSSAIRSPVAACPAIAETLPTFRGLPVAILRVSRTVSRMVAASQTLTAEVRFQDRVNELGGRPRPGARYVNNSTPVPLICANGHECAPRPSNVLAGNGLCPVCAGRDKASAERRFLSRVDELHARLQPGACYVRGSIPVPLICANGHECAPRPQDALRGGSLCKTCSGRDPVDSERRFWARVEELGGKPQPGARYVNNSTPVPLICANGHECAPRPGVVLGGRVLCRSCTGHNKASTEWRFWVRVEELGGKPQPGARYVNNSTPVPLICANGHECAPLPKHVIKGQGLCRTCAGNDPVTAERRFWVRVEELGGKPQPGARYVNNSTPVPLICANGHECAPRPGDLSTGRRICLSCAVVFDRIFVLHHPRSHAIKVGTASIEHRLYVHRQNGYVLVAEWAGRDQEAVQNAESQVFRAWREHAWPIIPDAPFDGRTGTADVTHLPFTLSLLRSLLGEPDTQA